MTWSWDYTQQILDPLLAGLWVTVKATLLGFVVALVLGLAFALGRRSGRRWQTWPLELIVQLIRSTPLLIVLYILFYVLPDVGVTLGAFTAGVIGLGLYYSAYVSEVYRAGIESVPRGQWEAARALGLSNGRTWRAIVLPQAIPAVIPALGNYLSLMFKDSALLATITVIELLGAALSEASFTYRYLEPITLVGLFYLVVSYVSSIGVRRVEAHYRRA